MASLEQIQKELQLLPQEALNLVYQFIQLLKGAIQPVTQQNQADAQVPNPVEGSVYEKFKASGLIGCANEVQPVEYSADDPKAQLYEKLAPPSQRLSETADEVPLTSLIGAAPGNFATPAAADQFIRQERDEWHC
ncbi:MAG: hypothetical protein AAF329_19460 [Cyanobacteria bacterium P01_A01_bin.17]